MSKSNQSSSKETSVRKRPSWAKTFFDVAEIIARRSKDPNTQVGAVLVKENSIIGTGYNAEPRDSTLLFNWHTSEKYKYVIHAEINAIANASRLGVSVVGSDIYITHSPCANCMNSIVQNGIKRVFYKTPHVMDYEISKQIAFHAGVELMQVIV